MFKIADLRCRAQIPSIREKRILAPLPSDSGGRPVPGKYGDGVLEGKQLLPNAFQEQVSIPAGKIPAPDTSTEKNVSADNNLLIQKMKAQAPRAMSRHVVNLHGGAEQLGGLVFGEQEVGFERFDFQSEAPIAEKFTVSHHERGFGVHGGLATVAPDDRRGISDVVEVAVGQHQEMHRFASERGICSLRSVEKNAAGRCCIVETIGVKHAPGKGFEPIHEKMVREKVMSKFDFLSSVCKLFTSCRMKRALSCLSCAAAMVLAGFVPAPLAARSSVDPGQVAISVARWLEQGHYTREKLDDKMSGRFLQTYLTTLDYNKLYFIQPDIDEFAGKYSTTLGDSVLRGDLGPAREIFARFRQRVEDRVAKNKKLAQKKYAFDSSRAVEINRQDAPWPKNQEEADRIWQSRIEAELLKETLAELKLRPPQETVTRRYDQVLRNVREMEDDDVVKAFLSALAQTYDPHSEYLSPSDLENFQISMKLSLVGVGAVLSSEDGYAKVKEIVPGGPADRDGRLTVSDRVAAVAQGDAEFEDVVDMKLDKVVEKIRGKKGTVVRLLVIPGDATDPSKRKIVEIRRDEVKLKDQEAKAEVLDLDENGGRPVRIGWITLPSFYANMENRGTPKSTTEDVALLIARLKREGIQGLVIDLRRDGGGSLEEAINLTGLFIPKGPVVQAKDSNGKITVSQDTNPVLAYSGPLIVLTNRLSASASEIFAAALQDYGRAVVIGDERTFGKGTVQTVLDLGRLMSPFSLGTADAGALKLTIQKFYRVRGGSTQLNGVESDMILPSLTDNSEIGEGSLKNRLAYDEVAPVKIADSMAATPLFLNQLKARSGPRVAADPEFLYTMEDMRRVREKITENKISLNEKVRRKELVEDKKRKELREKERQSRGPALEVQAYELTLDDLAAPKLRPVAFDRKQDKSLLDSDDDETETKKATPEPDPIRNESLRIMRDFIEFNQQMKTASIQGESPL